MAHEIKVDVQQKLMALSGELTIFSVADIRKCLLEVLAGLDGVSLDLRDVTEIDTAGLQLMLLAKCVPGKTVRFCNHSNPVLRLIDLANVGQMLGDPLLIQAA